MGPQRVQLESRPLSARAQHARRNATTERGPHRVQLESRPSPARGQARDNRPGGGSAAGTFSVNRREVAWRKGRGHIQRQQVGSGLEEEAPRAHSASTGEDRPGGSAAGTFSVNGRGPARRKRRGHIQRQQVGTGLEEAPRAHSASTGGHRPGGSAAGTFSANRWELAWRTHSSSTGVNWPGGSAVGTFSVNRWEPAWRKRRGHIQRRQVGTGLEEAAERSTAARVLVSVGGSKSLRSWVCDSFGRSSNLCSVAGGDAAKNVGKEKGERA